MDTFILGIDVAAHKVDVWWSEKQPQSATLEYTGETLDGFLAAHPEITPARCIIGMESTGDYHLMIARYFLKQGFTVKILNPILTKQYTRATIRGTKTDKKDAEIIAKLVGDGHGETASLASLGNGKRELLRVAMALTNKASQLTLMTQSLKRKQMAGTEKATEEIAEIIASLKQLSKELVAEATQERSHDEELIDSIPGFAVKLSAIVHHEIGDITRFKNAKSLVSFAGLDPRIRQSGKMLNTTGRITKRGSSHLRCALYCAANVVRRFDPEFAAYYAKKKMEGRHHVEVLVMISRKLLHRIWAVLREQREYRVAA